MRVWENRLHLHQTLKFILLIFPFLFFLSLSSLLLLHAFPFAWRWIPFPYFEKNMKGWCCYMPIIDWPDTIVMAHSLSTSRSYAGHVFFFLILKNNYSIFFFLLAYANKQLLQDGRAVIQCFFLGSGWGETVFSIVLIVPVWILCAVRLHQRWCLWIPATLSVARLSPTARSHTRQQCRHARLNGRLLQGCIRLHKLYSIFLQPPSLCMHPPSHPSASALTVHTAVKFSVSPCFMLACSSRLSRFLYLCLDALLNICGYSQFFFFCF